MAMDAVMNFLETHNRPFSINEIDQGLKDIGKSIIQKTLNTLVQEEKVKEKVYGKQKVYYITQQSDTSASELKENLLEMDRKINEVTLELKEVSDKLKANTTEMTAMKGKITLGEALDKKLQLEKELDEVKPQLEQYSGTETICPKTKAKVDKDYERNVTEYKKRKRICMDMLNSILENYPKTKKHLYEEIGIETDEDAGFVINNL